MSSIYERIKQRRIELGMTVEELANKMGYKDKSSISKIENGKADIPTSKVVAFAKALETTTAYLLGADVDASPIPPGFDPIPKMRTIPLLGTIACGQPILAQQNIEGEVSMPDHIHADFALRCKGGSMIGARILDGDIVYIRSQPDVEDGQIAAVLIEDEATLKRVYKIPGRIQLRPENPNYEVLEYSDSQLDQIRILGLAVYFTSPVK